MPYDAVPRDSFLVATLDVAELRRSPLYEVLLGKEGVDDDPKSGGGRGAQSGAVLDPRTLGISELAEACGFDPLSRVEKLAVAVPEEGDKGELGVVARVEVTQNELSRCTEALAGRRGGKLRTVDIGKFLVVESDDDQAARPRLAYGHDGLLVVGRGAWFDAMLSTADGKKPGVREMQAHADVRASLTRLPAWHSPTLLVSAVLPRSLRERLRSEMNAELESTGAESGSLDIMSGVLGVSTAGAALRAGASGGSINALVELVCDSDDACAAVEKLVLKKRLDWSKEMMLRMVGFGPLLDSVEVEREGARLRVSASASADSLASTLERVLRLKARSSDTPRPAMPPTGRKDPGSATPPSGDKSDETIPATKPAR